MPTAGRDGGVAEPGGRVVRALSHGTWLGLDRIRVYSALLLGFSCLFAVWWVLIAQGALTPNGLPLGSDFVSFKAAADLALQHNGADAYIRPLHEAAERRAVGAPDIPHFAFFYPPVYLLICLPLGLLPYLGALALWFATTGAAFLTVLRRILPQRQAVLPMLAFPATLIQFTHGQNGFLTAALLGAAVLCLERRPLLAGALFGCLCYKPQFAILLPLALAAGGQWRAIAAAVVSVFVLSATSFAAFGYASWEGFFDGGTLARAVLEQGLVGFGKMQSVFAGVRLLGGSVTEAYLVQAVATVAVAAVVVRVWRSAAAMDLKGATLAVGCVLATPFVFDYDFTLLELALAWTVREGLARGFRPWEKLAGLALFVLPLVARTVAIDFGIPLSPVIVGLFFVVLTRRVLAGRVAVGTPALAAAG